MAKVEVTMPKMGESITEGTIVTWHKKPGDAIDLDESLLEIGTDKVDTDVPSPEAGTVAEIRFEEGETVDVGTVIAIIETDASGNGAVSGSGKAAAVPKAQAGEESNGTIASEKPDSGDSKNAEDSNDRSGGSEKIDTSSATPLPASSGGTVDVLMPKMGESVMEGTVLKWMKAPGDAIALDEILLEIATDKVDTEVPSPAAGTLKEILVPEGETVDVETPVAVIATGEGQPTSSTDAPSPATTAPSPAPSPTVESPKTSSATASQAGATLTGSVARASDDGRFLSPLVRSIAETEGIHGAELASITGTGREGRITKKDILAYMGGRKHVAAAAHSNAPSRTVLSPSAPVPDKAVGERIEIVKMDRMRQLISEHMIRSKTTSAHVTSFAEADVTNLVHLRERNKDAFYNREGVKLTYTPFFVFAAVEALREHPILNASVVEDTIQYKKDYHIGIAVAIGTSGLLVPVIRDAGQKNIVGLAHAAADLAVRSRSKQLVPDELQGGTFTVTNVGSLGSIMGTPIINQPQVGILATGVIKKRPVVVEDPVMGDTIGIRSMMYVSLSYDHRVVDGAMGSSFLAKFVNVVESFDRNEVIK